MSNYLGIRHEDKYLMERRAPLTPKHVKFLTQHHKLDVAVQHSTKRIFTDQEYIDAGAEIVDNLVKCSVILGVKEMPESFFEAGKTYVFFSHVIKGQSYNMPMLKRMMELGCNLIEYEKIIDEQAKRLIFFGRYAGLAGMINSFWAWGMRLKYFGFESKLLKIKQAYQYHSLKEAREDISAVGQMIAEEGIPHELRPFVIAFTGYGNVSQGAQEICGLLPVKEISPEKLLTLKTRKNTPDNIVYKVIFKEEDMFERIDGEAFDLQEYYHHPELYRSKFEQYISHLSMLINCVYWDNRYPRLITKEYLKKAYAEGQPKLMVIGDISCDIEGSMECTMKATEIGDPVFVYNPETEDITMGAKGEGIMVMSVDILPAELPRDASNGFGDVLVNFVKPILTTDFSLPFLELDLPRAIKKGLILHNGELTPEFEYLQPFVDALEAHL
ncbi:MAG: bifunctional lysine ketoglutarate reductase /saccharopine dehydrogenase family protein [Bacteroidota bacterium]